MKTLLEQLVELAKREHYNCEEDTWYGCPLSRDGCSRESLKECDCGAESHNEEVAKLVAELDAMLAKSRQTLDTVRINWLNENGRVAKFSDGWNAWNTRNSKETAISHDIRKAIDAAMRSVI